MNTIYTALSQANIKPPPAWNKASMRWLINNKKNISILNLSSIYRSMLESGAPPSSTIERYTFNYLYKNRESISPRDLHVVLENMAMALISPSVHMSAKLIEPHFLRLDYAIQQSLISPKDSFLIRLFYANATFRLEFFNVKDLPFLAEAPFPTQAKKSTGLERETDAILLSTFPNSVFSKEVKILNSLPSVDRYEARKKWIIEVDGPTHNTIVFTQGPNKSISLNTLPIRDLDIVTQEIYVKLGYKHVRVNQRLLNLEKNELELYLRQLLE